MSNNARLNEAKKAKQDEFYTQRNEIEQELQHYESHFKDMVIYCNCDDPSQSNFFHYFSYNFERLGLKKLITTCYKNKSRDLFSVNKDDTAISLEYNGDRNSNKIPDIEEIGVNKLKGDGDFRSDECIEYLKKSDLVVTNPPFSLFREYVDQLMKHHKKFIIIGHIGAISYKEIFGWIKDNRIKLGISIKSGDREFGVPQDYTLAAARYRVDDEGNKFIRVKGVRWFTNIDISKHYESLILTKKYNENEYLKYDNYNAINVDKVKDIPKDYDGVMGVPITFLDKHNPEQFEIIGVSKSWDKSIEMENIRTDLKNRHAPLIAGREKYARVFIKRKQNGS